MQTSNCEAYRPSGDRVRLKDIHVPNADKGEQQKADCVYHVIYGILVGRQLIHVLFLPCWDWSVNCWSWIFGTILGTSIYIAKICHRTRLANQSCCTCHLRGAGRGMWQHVDTPSNKLKKDSSLAPVCIARRRLIKEERVQRPSTNSPAIVSSRLLPTMLPHRLSRKQAKSWQD